MGLTPKVTSSGRTFFHDFQYYYSPGVLRLEVGDVSFDSDRLPVCHDIRTGSVRLAQSDSGEDQGSYDLKYARQDADGFYYDAKVSAQSFSLSATKVKVVKSPTQIEFIVLPAAR